MVMRYCSLPARRRLRSSSQSLSYHLLLFGIEIRFFGFLLLFVTIV